MIQLEISPELEERVIVAARARGMEPNAYASQIVTDAVALTTEKPLSKEASVEFLTQMASHAHEMPQLPDSAYTRESFYEDHG